MTDAWNRRACLIAFLVLPACSQKAYEVRPAEFDAARLVYIEEASSRCHDREKLARDGAYIACDDAERQHLKKLLDRMLSDRRKKLSSSEWLNFSDEQSRWSKVSMDECNNEPDFKENDGLTHYPGTAATLEHGACVNYALERRIAALIIRELKRWSESPDLLT